MRGKNNLWSTMVAFALLVTASAMAGCSTPPQKEIEAIGVVASEAGDSVGNDIVNTYTFDDGRTYSMRYNATGGIVKGGGVEPNPGDLLIAGSRPSLWMLVAIPRQTPEGCFGLGSQAGWDRQTTVDLDFGVTLQKAPNYDPAGHVALGHFDSRGVICLDREGRVTLIH